VVKRRPSSRRQKVKRCASCGETDVAKFNVNRSRWDGLQARCQTCTRAANTKVYRRQADERRARQLAAAPDEQARWDLTLKHSGFAKWRGHNFLEYEGNLNPGSDPFAEASDKGFGAMEILALAGCFGTCNEETREKFRFYRECK
jgi:hypothetical protein